MFGYQQPSIYGQPFQPVQQYPQYQQFQPVQVPRLLEVDGMESLAGVVMEPNARGVAYDRRNGLLLRLEADGAGHITVSRWTLKEYEEPERPPEPEYVTRAEFEEWKAAHDEQRVRQSQAQQQPAGYGQDRADGGGTVA